MKTDFSTREIPNDVSPKALTKAAKVLTVGVLALATYIGINLKNHWRDTDESQANIAKADTVLRAADEVFWTIAKTPEISVPEQQRAPIVRALAAMCGDFTLDHSARRTYNACALMLPDDAHAIGEVKPDDLVRYAKKVSRYEFNNMQSDCCDLPTLQTDKTRMENLRDALLAATPSNQSYGRRMTAFSPAPLP